MGESPNGNSVRVLNKPKGLPNQNAADGYNPVTYKSIARAFKCCHPHHQTAAPEVEEMYSCAGAQPFGGSGQAGNCDADFKFRADVCEVEEFIPRPAPNYPPLPPCVCCPLTEPFPDTPSNHKTLYIHPCTGELITEERIDRAENGPEYSYCYENWSKKGYHRDR